MSLMGFRISRVAHCIVGRSNLERTPCAFEVQGILWLWKTSPFPRGTPGQAALVIGMMYCSRFCLRTALRAAAGLQRYVKTPRRAPVRNSGNYQSCQTAAVCSFKGRQRMIVACQAWPWDAPLREEAALIHNFVCSFQRASRFSLWWNNLAGVG